MKPVPYSSRVSQADSTAPAGMHLAASSRAVSIYWTMASLLSVWLVLWIGLSWPAMQDDAFIHLRYAVNLLGHHMISYNGVHQDYGASSLLYVWLLAALYHLFASPILPRAVSTFFHLLLFGGLMLAFPRVLRSAPKFTWSLALLLLGILATPMSVRWLDDGMETSLTLCMVAVIAFIVSKCCHVHITDRAAAWLLVLGFAATLTRVECLLLFGVVGLLLLLAQMSFRTRNGHQTYSYRHQDIRTVLRCSAPLVGSVLAAALIRITMHSLIPDTAVAKAYGFRGWHGTLNATTSVFESSLSIGAFFTGFWLLTLGAVIVYKRRITVPMVLANSLCPIAVTLAAVRGQEVQGIRYFLWTLLFSVLWNILELRWSKTEQAPFASNLLQVSIYGLAALLLILQPVESKLLYKEFRARIESLAAMRAQHLDRLSPLRLVAYDIGYIGYFTDSPVCDMAGLVNGRARAMLSTAERVKVCANEPPQIAFLTAPGIGTLNNDLPLEDWSICSAYNLANLRKADIHYLIASPAATAQVCAAAGGKPRRLGPIMRSLP